MTTKKQPRTPPPPDEVAAILRENAPAILAIVGEAQRFAADIRCKTSQRPPPSE